MTTQETIVVPMDLALRLSHWHASMYDPIYAVGSCGIAKRPVSRKSFEAALDRIHGDLEDRENFLDSKAELGEIALQMRALLNNIQEERDFRQCVAHAMARSYWALAWANEEERQEDSGLNMAGAQLLEIAPQTPQRAVDAALEDLAQLEKDHGKPLFELYEPYKDLNPYDFGHELAMSVSGYGGNLDLKTHYTELDYYNFADEWIAEDPL